MPKKTYFMTNPETRKLLKKIRIKRSYPLTTKLEQKIQDAQEFDGWTVFMNNAHTLAHVMHRDYPDGYFRLRCHSTNFNLKQASNDRLILYFYVRLSKQIII